MMRALLIEQDGEAIMLVGRELDGGAAAQLTSYHPDGFGYVVNVNALGDGLAGPAWLEKLTDWWTRTGAKLDKAYQAVKGKLGKLKAWAREQRQAYAVEDCGRLFIIENAPGGGITYREIPDAQGRKVIRATEVPGWTSPCKPEGAPLPTSGATNAAGPTWQAMLPWIAGAALLLILLSRRSAP